MKVMMAVTVGATAVQIEAGFAAKLSGSSQIWSNPFGLLPHMGIVFPLNMAFGLSIEIATAVAGAPVPIPYRLDFEAGILGCGTPVLYKGEAGVLSELGESGQHTYVTNPNAMAGENRKLTRDEVDDFARAADGNARVGFAKPPELEGQMGLTIPGKGLIEIKKSTDFESTKQARAFVRALPVEVSHAPIPIGCLFSRTLPPGLKNYECAPGDMYGAEPTVIKIAMSIVIGVNVKFAFIFVIRQFYISRLIFMTLQKPAGSVLKAMVRPRSDRIRRHQCV